VGPSQAPKWFLILAFSRLGRQRLSGDFSHQQRRYQPVFPNLQSNRLMCGLGLARQTRTE
jgi:hypothetical protein